MRKLILIFGLLLLLAMAWAQIPVSMRYYALGTALDGEWEQIYDPIDLNFYLQKYYFTNLSDYGQKIYVYDGTVEFENNGKFLSEYPFGVTFKNPWKESLKHAFLISFRDDKVPGGSYGETEQTASVYTDTDGDLLFDIKQEAFVRTNDYNDMQSRLLLMLNSSLPINDGVFGVRLSLDTGKMQWDEASMDFPPVFDDSFFEGFEQGDNGSYFSLTTYDLVNNIMTEQYIDEGDFNTTNRTQKMQALVSYMKPSNWFGDNGELRYDLNLTFDNVNSLKIADKYTSMYTNYISETAHSEGSGAIEVSRTSTLPRNEVFLKAGYRKNADNMTPRFKQGFWEVGFGMGLFGGTYKNYMEYKMMTEEITIDTADLESQIIDILDGVQKGGDEGSYLGWHSILTGRSAINFSEYVSFGYGATFDMQTFNRKSDYDMLTVNAFVYHQEGTAFNDANDTRSTQSLSYNGKTELAQTNLVTTLPVGLEFSMPKTSLTDNDSFSLRNFCFRIGTTFIHNYNYKDYRRKMISFEVLSNIIEYGDGTVTEDHDDPSYSMGERSKSYDSYGTKRYSAGIGYNHSDFLNIDVGGYIDANTDEFFIGAMFTVKK